MPLSRRALLGASASASLGLACGAEPTPSVEPRLIGQDPERGHLLRSAALLDTPISERRKAAVVIVGGGAAGLSAAWHLRQAGIDDVELLELEPEIGGTARSGALPRSPHPMGAHYLPTPPPECSELLELLTELRLLVDRRHDGAPEYRSTAICPAPIERHFFANTWHPGLYPGADQTPAEAEDGERFWDRLRELDRARDEHGQRLFRLPVRRSSARVRALDRISMAQWLDQHELRSWRLRWYVDYVCRDDYGCSIEQTSAFAGLHHFLGRGLDDVKDREVLTWPGGNGELLAALRERVGLGERLRRDHLVYAIDPERGELRVRDLLGQRSVAIEAQAILWAAPRFLLAHLLPRGRDPLPSDALSYAPWLVANLELREAPGGLGATLAWDNVPVIEDPRERNLGYVVATHTQDRLAAYEPGAVITYYEPLVADTHELPSARARLLAGDARSWSEHVLRSLERMHPAIRKQLLHLHIHRWGHAMVRPVPGLLFGEALELARAPIGRVMPCAADVGGLPLFEEAFYAALAGADWARGKLA
ncbi:MAG: FAD-dependent oxidoreductase [Enhygromyxa sp.]